MGVVVGLINAVSVSTLGVFLKKLRGLDPHFLTWVRMASAAPVLALLVTIFARWSVPPLPFWLIITFISAPLEVLFMYLNTKAVHLSPLSLIGPLGTFTSIFLIPVGYVLLGELPTFLGLIGVLAVFVGSFFLGWQSEESWRYGIRNVFREPGSYLALLGAFIAALLGAVVKIAFGYAPPLLTAFYITTLVAFFLMPLVLRQSKETLRLNLKSLSSLGFLSGLGIALHNVGLSLIPAVYYVSVKRTSAVVDIIFGRLIFGEDHTRERMAGALLMVVGVVLIALG